MTIVEIEAWMRKHDTFGCPCCPDFSTYSKAALHDHFGTADCPFWERVFNGEVYVHVDE